MGTIGVLRDYNSRADAWLRARPALWVVLAAAVPGLAYAASQLAIGDASFVRAVTLGGVFGLTFAAVSAAGTFAFAD